MDRDEACNEPKAAGLHPGAALPARGRLHGRRSRMASWCARPAVAVLKVAHRSLARRVAVQAAVPGPGHQRTQLLQLARHCAGPDVSSPRCLCRPAAYWTCSGKLANIEASCWPSCLATASRAKRCSTRCLCRLCCLRALQHFLAGVKTRSCMSWHAWHSGLQSCDEPLFVVEKHCGAGTERTPTLLLLKVGALEVRAVMHRSAWCLRAAPRLRVWK